MVRCLYGICAVKWNVSEQLGLVVGSWRSCNWCWWLQMTEKTGWKGVWMPGPKAFEIIPWVWNHCWLRWWIKLWAESNCFGIFWQDGGQSWWHRCSLIILLWLYHGGWYLFWCGDISQETFQSISELSHWWWYHYHPALSMRDWDSTCTKDDSIYEWLNSSVLAWCCEIGVWSEWSDDLSQCQLLCGWRTSRISELGDRELENGHEDKHQEVKEEGKGSDK